MAPRNGLAPPGYFVPADPGSAAFDDQSLNEGQAQRLIQQGEHVLDQAALLVS
jgi:hypothetical protein